MNIFTDVSLEGNPIKRKKRIGRGYGSGKGGHTVGRGQKGQKSRGTSKVKLGFTGGQIPLHERLPKYRGIVKRDLGVRKPVKAVNVSSLDALFKAGSIINKAAIVSKGIARRSDKIKILGHGELKKKLKIVNLNVSLCAKEKIEKAGGEVINEG